MNVSDIENHDFTQTKVNSEVKISDDHTLANGKKTDSEAQMETGDPSIIISDGHTEIVSQGVTGCTPRSHFCEGSTCQKLIAVS